MALFLDTSAFVKLLIEEPGSAEVRRLVATERDIIMARLAYLECIGTIRRKQGEQLLTSSVANDLLKTLRQSLIAGTIRFIPFSDAIENRAVALLDAHGDSGLRTLDAIHLASCLESGGSDFVLADRKLGDVARREGINVILAG